RRRALAVHVGWTALCGGLAAIGVAVGVQGALGRTEDPRSAVVAAPAVMWIAVWVWLCSRSVWTYRRPVPSHASSDDPYLQSSAVRHGQVTMRFTLRELTGVELHGLRPTRAARFVNGQWPLVGHAAAVGLIVIALAWS